MRLLHGLAYKRNWTAFILLRNVRFVKGNNGPEGSDPDWN